MQCDSFRTDADSHKNVKTKGNEIRSLLIGLPKTPCMQGSDRLINGHHLLRYYHRQCFDTWGGINERKQQRETNTELYLHSSWSNFNKYGRPPKKHIMIKGICTTIERCINTIMPEKCCAHSLPIRNVGYLLWTHAIPLDVAGLTIIGPVLNVQAALLWQNDKHCFVSDIIRLWHSWPPWYDLRGRLGVKGTVKAK